MFKYFVFNLLITVLVYVYYKRTQSRDIAAKIAILLCMPFVGLVLLLFIQLSMKIKPVHILDSDFSFHGDSTLFSFSLRKLNVEKEMNIIPIQDALAVNSDHVKRKLMMDTLKGDSYDYLGFLTKAVKDHDTETSHYAATAIAEIKRGLTLSLQSLELRYEKETNNMSFLLEYANILKKYIESGLLDEKSRIRYIATASKVLSTILERDTSLDYVFEEKINMEIHLENYKASLQYCKKYMDCFKVSERPLFLFLKVYFVLRDKTNFNKVVAYIMKSEIEISSKTHEMIDLWNERKVTC